MVNTLRTRVRELEEQLADTRRRLTRLEGEHVEVVDELAELARTIRPRGHQDGADS